MAGKIFKNDVYTMFRINGGKDLTLASSLTVKVKKPDGSEVEWTGELYSLDNNKIKYIIQPGDLDQSGQYKANAYYIFPDWEGRGNTFKFTVYEPYT